MDPTAPSAPCTGADGGAASSCGKDSSFSAAVTDNLTDNLTGREMSDCRATPSGSTSLCVFATKLVLCALADNEQLYYAKQNNNICPKTINENNGGWPFSQAKDSVHSNKNAKSMKASILHFAFYPFESLETILRSTKAIHQPAA